MITLIPFSFTDASGIVVTMTPLDGVAAYEYQCPGCGGTHHFDPGVIARPQKDGALVWSATRLVFNADGSPTIPGPLRCPQSCGWGVQVAYGQATTLRSQPPLSSCYFVTPTIEASAQVSLASATLATPVTTVKSL